MPLCEEPDPVDIVRLAAVDRLEVVETIEWVESGVVGELLPGDWFFGLQAKDCVDVFLLLGVCEGSPSSKRRQHICLSGFQIQYTHHSFLTRGFSQRVLRFCPSDDGAGQVLSPFADGVTGAARAMRAEAKRPVVVWAKRIIETLRYS